MAKSDVYRYVLRGKELVSYPKNTGSRFEVYYDNESGEWHWRLALAYSPQGYAARSDRGYPTQNVAAKSILSAVKAMRDAEA